MFTVMVYGSVAVVIWVCATSSSVYLSFQKVPISKSIVISVSWPEHISASPLMVAVGNGFTVTWAVAPKLVPVHLESLTAVIV